MFTWSLSAGVVLNKGSFDAPPPYHLCPGQSPTQCPQCWGGETLPWFIHVLQPLGLCVTWYWFIFTRVCGHMSTLTCIHVCRYGTCICTHMWRLEKISRVILRKIIHLFWNWYTPWPHQLDQACRHQALRILLSPSHCAGVVRPWHQAWFYYMHSGDHTVLVLTGQVLYWLTCHSCSLLLILNPEIAGFCSSPVNMWLLSIPYSL